MAEKGQVIEIKGGIAVVKMTRTEACAKCRACIAGMKKEDTCVEADNGCDAKVDDWVEVELRENGFIVAVLIMYGIPFVALIIGIMLGNFVISPYMGLTNQSSELVSFGVGILFTAIAFLWIKSQEARWESKKYRPFASKITTAE